MSRKLVFLILGLWVSAVWGQEFTASGSGVHFKLIFGSQKMTYEGHGTRTNFLHLKCSQSFLQSFRKQLLTSIRDPKSLVHNSKLTLSLEKNVWHVNPQSRLGLLLIGMDDEIVRMKLMEKRLCRK